ncbi:MAG: glutamate--tRNA ligase [Flavobacteriales bacterium]|nr:glutamate--tRNA ligase [Flavobacteriales bacterium]
MSDKRIRVRFAPSPTGPLHIGGVRTALYNYLYARHHGGDFLLRIEDTDRTRFVPGAEEYIIDSLKWLGIEPDEGVGYGGEKGPYRQSERKDIYAQYAEQLIENGYAYYAFDTPADLEAIREQAKKAKVASWQYNNITRNSMKNSLTLPADEVESRIASGEPYVIRFKMPRGEEVRFEDAIRGWVSFSTDQLDDKVLMKNDGMPTYHLANIVDDHLMEITHVIRGEEWLPSAPLHVMLYKGMGWEAPTFAHLSLILKPNGKGKLSKRDGDEGGFPVFPLDWKDPKTGATLSGYRESGYYPEAVVNILAFLGWNPGTTQEIFSKEELVQSFTMDRVGRSGAKFDPEKAKWYNQQYLRMRSDEELAGELIPLLQQEGLTPPREQVIQAVSLLKERAFFIKDMLEGRFMFAAPESYDEKMVRKKWKEETPQILSEVKQLLVDTQPFEAAILEETFKSFLERKGLGMGAVMPNLRLAVTGKAMGPSFFDTLEIIGPEAFTQRIDKAIASITT